MMATTTSVSEVRGSNGAPHVASPPFMPDRLVWHDSTPQRIAAAGDWSAGSAGWEAWAKRLGRRKRPLNLGAIAPGRRSPLAWGVETVISAEMSKQLARLAPGRKARRLGDERERALYDDLNAWLDSASAVQTVPQALVCLAWCHALPKLAEAVPADRWWKALDRLLEIARDAEAGRAGDPHVVYLLTVELPLTLAMLFPELVNCRELAATAAANLKAATADWIDAEGAADANRLSLIRPWLASWARLRLLARGSDESPWDQAMETFYGRFLRHALRLRRRDGSQVFADSHQSATDRPLFAAALVDVDDETARIGAAAVKNLTGKKLRRLHVEELPRPGFHSESAGWALLRNSWRPDSERIAVTFAGPKLRSEASCSRQVLWSGVWDLEVSLDGRRLSPEGNWEQVCWQSDEEVDYLELEIALSEEVTVQRQVLLAREDRFALLADAVLCAREGAIDYRGALPLVDEIHFDPSGESREGYLVGDKPRGMVFPLALPEWRSETRGGSLAATSAGLELRQSHPAASRLYCPLFVDFDSKRMLRPGTWRSLTVAENRVIQRPDTAVGYRVQVGKEQWLFYRSLAAERGNRTVLGQNLVCEFMAGRFKRTGEVEQLLEIE